MNKKTRRPQRTGKLIEIRQRRTASRGPAILCEYNPITRRIEFQQRGVRSSVSLKSLLGIDRDRKVVYTESDD